MEQLGRLTRSEGVLTALIWSLEQDSRGVTSEAIDDLVGQHGLKDDSLEAALYVKRVAGQVNVVIHALGIMAALPHILEPGEVVESLSLGAGNTGRRHDLETDRRIAEFKFIDWRGGAEAIRQNGVFVDLFNLASDPSPKRRCLYLVGTDIPLRFLRGRRAIASVLSHESKVAADFTALHGDRFATVGEYFATVERDVEIVDLTEVLPVFRRPTG